MSGDPASGFAVDGDSEKLVLALYIRATAPAAIPSCYVVKIVERLTARLDPVAVAACHHLTFDVLLAAFPAPAWQTALHST